MNVVKVNPYESPRAPDPLSPGALGESHSIIQLLTEIRDGQQQLLQVQRDALTRQRRNIGVSLLFALPILLLPLLTFFITARTRTPPPVLPPFPRPAPAVAPARPPPAASLLDQ